MVLRALQVAAVMGELAVAVLGWVLVAVLVVVVVKARRWFRDPDR